jgi:thiol-disulfide isomerase/thioredoxin
MTSGKIILITLLVGILSVVAGVLGNRYLTMTMEGAPTESSLLPRPLKARTTLPEFTLPDLEGRPVASNRWAGKVLVLNFWATWCSPCRREIPLFVRLQNELGSQGLQFVGIAVDAPEPVRDFVVREGINYPVLLGDEASIEMSKQLGNRFQGLPFSVIFDRRGRVIHAHAGELREETIRERIAGLM